MRIKCHLFLFGILRIDSLCIIVMYRKEIYQGLLENIVFIKRDIYNRTVELFKNQNSSVNDIEDTACSVRVRLNLTLTIVMSSYLKIKIVQMMTLKILLVP